MVFCFFFFKSVILLPEQSDTGVTGICLALLAFQFVFFVLSVESSVKFCNVTMSGMNKQPQAASN